MELSDSLQAGQSRVGIGRRIGMLWSSRKPRVVLVSAQVRPRTAKSVHSVVRVQVLHPFDVRGHCGVCCDTVVNVDDEHLALDAGVPVLPGTAFGVVLCASLFICIG